MEVTWEKCPQAASSNVRLYWDRMTPMRFSLTLYFLESMRFNVPTFPSLFT